MKNAVRLCIAALLTVCLLASADARAQIGQEKVDAQGLFDLGKRLMVDGKFSEACPKLEDSLRLDPVLGTMLFLGECYESMGRTASAWAQFREAQSLAVKESDTRAKVARDRANALEPRLSKLVIVVPSSSAPDLKVLRDGLEVQETLWGAAIAIDPGQHVVLVTAPNKKDWTTNVTVGVGTSSNVTVPLLEDSLTEPAVVVTSAAVRQPTFAPHAEDPHRGPTQRILGVGAASLGVVGLGIGTVFGLQAKSNLDASNDGHCVKVTNTCDAPGLDKRSTAVTDGTISTVSFGLGLAALAGGAVLYFTAPKADTSAIAILPAAGPRGGSLTLRASF